MWVCICPSAYRSVVIWQTHNMAHSGRAHTLSRVRLSWYWPGMMSQVRQAVQNCETCQIAKSGGTHPIGSKLRLYTGRPWQKVAVNLVGPMPMTLGGNNWLLILTDHFTRWQDAIAISNGTAPIVATTSDERVFCYFGLPEQIHTYQCAQFESWLMEELCRLLKVEHTHTTPYHPQANG